MRAVHGEEDLQRLPRLRRAWQALQSGQGWAPGCRLAQPDAGFRTVQDFLGAIEQAIAEALLPCVCRGHDTAVSPCQQPLRQGLTAGCSVCPSVRLSCMPLRRALGPGWKKGKYPQLVLAVRRGGGQIVESAHRVVAFMMGAFKPKAPYALHHPCCPPRCCNPLHLRWGSAADNGRDRTKKVEWKQSCHGLWKFGSASRVVENLQNRAWTRVKQRLGQGKKRRRSAATLMLLEAKLVIEGKRQPKPTLKSCTWQL